MTTPSPEHVQTQVLDYVRQGQEAMTTMLAAVSENLSAAMRTAPGAGGAATPTAGVFPSPAAAIDQAFDMTIQLLEAQRSFVHSLLDAAGPAAAAR